MKFHRSLAVCLAIAAATAMAPRPLRAQFITEIRVRTDRLAVNETLNVGILIRPSGDNSKLWCGVLVSFGDGDDREILVEKPQTLLIKQYRAPGNYTVRLEGKFLTHGVLGILSAIPCIGSARSLRVTVAEPVVPRPPERDGANEDAQRKVRPAAEEAAKNSQVPQDSPPPLVKAPSSPPVKRPAASTPVKPFIKPRDNTIDVFK